jgi:hypothetical protein
MPKLSFSGYTKRAALLDKVGGRAAEEHCCCWQQNPARSYQKPKKI